MTPQEFQRELQRKQAELQRAMQRTIPLKASVAMEQHTKDNFRLGGFVNGGLKPWKPTLRQRYGKGADSQYTPLLSRERKLMNANRHRYQPFTAIVFNDMPYAKIHNEGGRIRVTKRMQRFFWAKFKETGNDMYKAMACKRVGEYIYIPRRQFIGESAELNTKVQNIIDDEITKILKL